MYGTDGIMPGATNTSDQEAELRYQVSLHYLHSLRYLLRTM